MPGIESQQPERNSAPSSEALAQRQMLRRGLLQIELASQWYQQQHGERPLDRNAINQALTDWTSGEDSPARRYEGALSEGAKELSGQPSSEELARAAAKILGASRH